ncbi:MAG: hypothetical protein QOJ39_2759 [Candidatus Eremiobacteraeota bacterium]|nr:hypothetical protein [Candidatus Eremiobacteraeota bacterium]
MRPLPDTVIRAVIAVLATAVGLTALPASAAPRSTVPVSVLVVADVGESAQHTMPAALWRKLVAEYAGPRRVIAEDGTALPDAARCRSAHAQYAVFATFDRAMRLPGMQQDIGRAYGIARFTVLDCISGTVSPTKTVRVESDPLTDADRAADGTNAERTWDHAVRRTLASHPLVLAPAAAAASPAPAPADAIAAPTALGTPRAIRITRVSGSVVYLESGGGFAVNQVLLDVADRSAKPHAPIELMVVDVNRTYIEANVVGKGSPQVGDYVEAAPAAAK